MRRISQCVLTACLVAGGTMVFTPELKAVPVTGGSTTVNFNSTTLSALVGLGFSITPIAPGTANLSVPSATFPITGGDTTTLITHSGGLTFAKGGSSASISNFTINLLGSTLTGDLATGGSTTHNFTFFDLGAGGALTLDSALGAGLSSVFGIPNLTGASIGTASVNATLAPEPATAGIYAVSFLIGLGVMAKRKSLRS